jgi:hypothetical protein
MKTLLQTIADALEAGGVRVTGIETYPPDNGAVSVSLTVRADQKAENLVPEPIGFSDFVKQNLEFCPSASVDVREAYCRYKQWLAHREAMLGIARFTSLLVKRFPCAEYKHVETKEGLAVFLKNLQLKPEASTKDERDPDLENRLAAPGAGMGGCHDCPGGPQCDDCPASPENSTPIKLYTPLEAVDAMMQGKVLRDERGNKFFWEDRGSQGAGFWFRDENDDTFPVRDFRGLYIGAAHA